MRHFMKSKQHLPRAAFSNLFYALFNRACAGRRTQWRVGIGMASGVQEPQEVERLFGDLQGANFNAVFAQMRRRGDAFYESQLVPENAGYQHGLRRFRFIG
jgi:uncharacterized lipoprotein YddW (UPF0748 family)